MVNPQNAKPTRQCHGPMLKQEAVFLARLGWGGANRIAKFLGRRHGLDLSPFTVQDWIRGVRRDIDPLDRMAAAA